MTMKIPELWLRYVNDDLQSAKVLLKAGIFNMVCFHSQQAVEKLFKSIIATYDQEIPKIHNLIRLHQICEDLYGETIELDDEGLIFLNDVYIDSRYPADFGILPSGQTNKEEAKQAYTYANEIIALLRPFAEARLKSNK